jgi:hypothetical protein
MTNDVVIEEKKNETIPLRGILRNTDEDIIDYNIIRDRLVIVCLILLSIFIITPIIVCVIVLWGY